MFLWLFLVALGLNIVTVIVEALANYFYFAVSFASVRFIGYSRLERFEGRNRAFIGDLPIVSMLVAPMGYGKTTQLVAAQLVATA